MARAQINKGTDQLSLKFTEDSKRVLLLTAAGARTGQTDAGTALTITYVDDNFIVAERSVFQTIDALIIDRRNHKAVWSNTGFDLGLWGESITLQCT